MRNRSKRSPSVLDELDTRPLTDAEIIGLGYTPTENGWVPHRKENPAERTTADEQSKLPATTPEVTPLDDQPPVAGPRKARPGRAPRQGRQSVRPS